MLKVSIIKLCINYWFSCNSHIFFDDITGGTTEKPGEEIGLAQAGESFSGPGAEGK